MVSDGSAASPSRSSAASWYAMTASVSKLKGRSTRVAGNSGPRLRAESSIDAVRARKAVRASR